MKRLLQFASVLLAIVVCVQPVLAAAGCTLRLVESHCPMGLAAMGPDCPMAQQPTCASDCCRSDAPHSFAAMAVPGEPRIIALTVALPAFDSSGDQRTRVDDHSGSASWSPPRYLLNHVFRI